MIGQSVCMLMPSTYAKLHDTYVKEYFRTNTAKLIGVPRVLLGIIISTMLTDFMLNA